jgi:hypothetical protein
MASDDDLLAKLVQLADEAAESAIAADNYVRHNVGPAVHQIEDVDYQLYVGSIGLPILAEAENLPWLDPLLNDFLPQGSQDWLTPVGVCALHRKLTWRLRALLDNPSLDSGEGHTSHALRNVRAVTPNNILDVEEHR